MLTFDYRVDITLCNNPEDSTFNAKGYAYGLARLASGSKITCAQTGTWLNPDTGEVITEDNVTIRFWLTMEDDTCLAEVKSILENLRYIQNHSHQYCMLVELAGGTYSGSIEKAYILESIQDYKEFWQAVKSLFYGRLLQESPEFNTELELAG